MHEAREEDAPSMYGYTSELRSSSAVELEREPVHDPGCVVDTDVGT
jgi:hypothetical protein